MKIVKGIDKIEVKYIEKQKTERQLKHLLFPLHLIVFHLPFVPMNQKITKNPYIILIH